MPRSDTSTFQITRERTRSKTKMPPFYRVVLLNDDYTTMEFVVAVLMEFFGHSEQTAMLVMLFVHKTGRGTAGVYSREIAETKINQVHSAARKQGFPLRCIMEQT